MGENDKSFLLNFFDKIWDSFKDLYILKKKHPVKLTITLVAMIVFFIIHSPIISFYEKYFPNRVDQPKVYTTDPEPKRSDEITRENLADTPIVKELQEKGLIQKLNAAMYGYNYENRKEQIKGLSIFSDIVNNLSKDALKQLNKELLESAAKDDSAGLHKQAIDKYRRLFSAYVRK